jgi:mannosyl-oligosaccharide glucosidase
MLSIKSTSIVEQIDSGKALYDTIRFRLIDTVYKNWRLNHVFWEQYNDSTQLGLMTNPFTGWTSLILLVVA